MLGDGIPTANSDKKEPFRVLVIDDNPAIHRDFRKILEAPPLEEAALLEMESALFGDVVGRRSTRAPIFFQIDSAEQGQQGLSKVEQALGESRPYALAFVDVRMPPGWDGIDTTRRIWQADPALQVVICSAFSDYSWEEMVDKLGAGDQWVILKKPFDPVEVLQLANAFVKKWELWREKQCREQLLEQLVQERTEKLEQTVARLRREMAERKVIEAELRKAHKLEALGRVAAGVGHEINNPLCLVTGNLEYLERVFRDFADVIPEAELEELNQCVREAMIGADRIVRVVQELRVLSRFEDQFEAIDVQEVLDLAVKMVARESQQVTILRDKAPVPLVNADRGRLEQVFANLLLNAVQSFAGQNHNEANERNAVRVKAASTGQQVVVMIEDNGPGIAEQDLGRIFEPFFTTKPMGQGTGLGLFICRRILSALGGEIAIESERGKGTTVQVTLPVAAQDSSAPQRARELEVEEIKPARLLVIGDDPLSSKAMARMLNHHEVIVANGIDALDAQGGDFDVVFCDLMMDETTGLDVYEHIKRKWPGKEERIVFLSGGLFDDKNREFFDRLPNICISKPYSYKEIGLLIQRIMEESEQQ